MIWQVGRGCKQTDPPRACTQKNLAVLFLFCFLWCVFVSLCVLRVRVRVRVCVCPLVVCVGGLSLCSFSCDNKLQLTTNCN